ncbi:hypothetical protein [Streptomyces cinerochromogenes]
MTLPAPLAAARRSSPSQGHPRRHWQGEAHDGFRMYNGKLPIAVTGM